MTTNAPHCRYQCWGPVALYTARRGQERFSAMTAPHTTAAMLTGSPQRPRENPAPGTPAFAAKEQRDAAKAARHGTVVPEAGTDAAATDTVVEDRPSQRQQPKRQSREQRKKQGKSPQKGSGQQQSRPDDTPPTHEKQ